MKNYYYCEVCNERFTDLFECDRHEKKCREKHATNFRLVKEINQTIQEAHIYGKQIPVAIKIPDGRTFVIDSAEYNAENQIIILNITD